MSSAARSIWRRLQDLARQYGLPIVEDATESLGARYRGTPVGRHGTVACFSFNGNKLMTTGGGGMLVTDDPALAERARYLATTAKDDPVEGIHGAVGFNYRLPALAGRARPRPARALRYLGRGQAAHRGALPEASRACRASVSCRSLRAATASSGSPRSGSTPKPRPSTDRLSPRILAAAGIATRPFWQPLHLSPAFRGATCLGGAVAEQLHREVLSLPCSCGLTEAQQERVICGSACGLSTRP